MAQTEAKVEQQFNDTKFSSGDYNDMTSKQIYQEENNNVVDDLTKGVAEMGCIVDVAKRAPNVCVENCVYTGPEDSPSDAEKDDEDAYSEEFEEDKSDDDDVQTMKMEPANTVASNASSVVENEPDDVGCPCSVQLSKSHITMSSKRGTGSVSGRSDFGSVSVPGTRRVNMSFSNDRLREIQRHNHILLKKILSARNMQKSSIPSKETTEPKKPVPAAAMHRKRQQRQIDHDNMILLRKIQRAKSSSCSIRR